VPTKRATEQLIDRTLEVWQPHTSRVLTREDARQIIENIVGFFSALRDWHAAERSPHAPGATRVAHMESVGAIDAEVAHERTHSGPTVGQSAGQSRRERDNGGLGGGV
jgi:hypothetical protein